MSWLNVINAFIDDFVIVVSVTLPFKYCPLRVKSRMRSGIYTAIVSKVKLLLLRAIKETVNTIFFSVNEHFNCVPLSPSSPVTFSDKFEEISTDMAFASTKEN